VEVIGGHSAETMIPVLSQVPGITFTHEEQKKLNERIREAGTVVVNAKAGLGSATLSMAYAGARFTNSLVRAFHGENVTEIAFIHVEGLEYGADYFGVRFELGKEGVTKIYPMPKLNEYEQSQLKDIITPLKENIEKGIQFGSAKL